MVTLSIIYWSNNTVRLSRIRKRGTTMGYTKHSCTVEGNQFRLMMAILDIIKVTLDLFRQNIKWWVSLRYFAFIYLLLTIYETPTLTTLNMISKLTVCWENILSTHDFLYIFFKFFQLFFCLMSKGLLLSSFKILFSALKEYDFIWLRRRNFIKMCDWW